MKFNVILKNDKIINDSEILSKNYKEIYRHLLDIDIIIQNRFYLEPSRIKSLEVNYIETFNSFEIKLKTVDNIGINQMISFESWEQLSKYSKAFKINNLLRDVVPRVE